MSAPMLLEKINTCVSMLLLLELNNIHIFSNAVSNPFFNSTWNIYINSLNCPIVMCLQIPITLDPAFEVKLLQIVINHCTQTDTKDCFCDFGPNSP